MVAYYLPSFPSNLPARPKDQRIRRGFYQNLYYFSEDRPSDKAEYKKRVIFGCEQYLPAKLKML